MEDGTRVIRSTSLLQGLPMTTALQFERTRSADVVSWAHDDLELDYSVIGRVAKAHKRTVIRWKDRTSAPSPKHRTRLRHFFELRRLMGLVFTTPVDGKRWLHTPIPALKDQAPIDFLRRGSVRPVLEVLATFHSGAFV
jgi:uncharacterized protein (DUF2384 family)